MSDIMKMRKSLFHIVSIGYAAENLEIGSKELKIYPPEFLGYLEGEINQDSATEEVSGKDYFGREYKASATITNCLKAKWLQWGSNRQTPPNIRRSERVVIWRYGNSDKYYWTAYGEDDHLRRLETVIWTFSDTKDESVTALTPDNSYYFIISTHRKEVTFGTAKSDGEPFKYVVQFDTKTGVLTIADDVGNHIELNSALTRITVENADKSGIELTKKIVNIYSSDQINMKTKALSIDVATMSVKASSSITYKSPTFSINANISTMGTFTNNGTNISSTHRHPESIGVITGTPS